MSRIPDKYCWLIHIANPQHYRQIVATIKEHGWPCSPVLTEDDGFDRKFDQATRDVFYDPEKKCLMKGRWDGALPNLTLTQFIEKMKELEPEFMPPLTESLKLATRRLMCYDAVNKAKDEDALTSAIFLCAGEDNYIQDGTSQRVFVPDQVIAVERVVHRLGKADVLTKAFGIRQQALYLRHKLRNPWG